MILSDIELIIITQQLQNSEDWCEEDIFEAFISSMAENSISISHEVLRDLFYSYKDLNPELKYDRSFDTKKFVASYLI